MKNQKRTISSAVATDRDQKAAAIDILQKNRLESSLSAVHDFALKLVLQSHQRHRQQQQSALVEFGRLDDLEVSETENDEEIEGPEEDELDEDALAAIDSLFDE